MDCIFCKISNGAVPCERIFESSQILAFLDISPLSEGHTLIVPKVHFEKLHEIPDTTLQEILPLAKKIANALGCSDYNLLQNNGSFAHQAVRHAHFHIIPKTGPEGLKLSWNPIEQSAKKLAATGKRLREKLSV